MGPPERRTFYWPGDEDTDSTRATEVRRPRRRRHLRAVARLCGCAWIGRARGAGGRLRTRVCPSSAPPPPKAAALPGAAACARAHCFCATCSRLCALFTAGSLCLIGSATRAPARSLSPNNNTAAMASEKDHMSIVICGHVDSGARRAGANLSGGRLGGAHMSGVCAMRTACGALAAKKSLRLHASSRVPTSCSDRL
jgi:hypothetical protein